MKKFIFGLSTIALTLSALNAEAFEVSVKVDNPQFMRLTDSKGSDFKLQAGLNTIQMEESQNPVTLSKTEKGKLAEVIYNGDWQFPAAGPHTFTFSEGDILFVYTTEDTGTVTLAINGDSNAAELKVDGQSRSIGSINVPIGALIEFSPRPGYVIYDISISPDVDITRNGDIWSFKAMYNHNISIFTHADVEENAKINVDNATNMTVRDALGNILPLTNGDNYLSLDPASQSPLTVKANRGAYMEMVVCNGEMLFPDNAGIYTMTLSAEKFNEIWLMSQRSQTNTITINVDNAERVNVADSFGEIALSDGSNLIAFDFDRGNPLTITASKDAILRAVAMDGQNLDISDNNVTFNVIRGAVIDIVTAENVPVDTGWITLVNEDFSGLKDGSEDEPDLNATILDDFGYALLQAGFNPYHESCTQTWGGDRLYPAGQTIAVMGGFLNTPVGDYSGDLKLTFKARLVPAEISTRHGLDVMLIRHSRLDEFKRTTFTLTHEWQEFTFTADNGWFYDTKIQFFMLDDTCYQIDDVKIEHKITGIEPPVALLAEDLANDSFTAMWTSTETADEYLLSVYEHGPVTDDYQISEDFEDITVEDGHVVGINEGWEYNLSAKGDRKEYNDDPEFAGSGSKAICFDAAGDYIVTPAAQAGIKELSFHISVDTSDPAYDPKSGQVIAVGALADGGWREWLNISVPYIINQCNGEVTVTYTDELEMFDNVYAFRIEAVMEENDATLIFIDDIKYTVAGTPELIYLLEDYVIEGQENTSHFVGGEDFDPEADYFYTVKARNSRYTSIPSNEIEVFNIHQPEAFTAADITTDSFTARWDCGGKADSFYITLYETLEADKDEPSKVVLYEDFSKAKGKGNAFKPEVSNPTSGYVSIDHLTEMPGWKASSYTTIDGMVGGMAADEGAVPPRIAGAICTPVMDLSNNNGNCHVKVRGWFHAGDGLIIQGKNGATFAAVPTSVDAEYEIEVDLPLCSEEEMLTFYSPFYNDFMIDEITITQDLHAGDKVKIHTGVIEITDKTAREQEITNLKQFEDHALSYDVYAKRYFHGNPDLAYSSLRSNEVAVTLDPSETISPEDSSNIRILSGKEHILVSTPATMDLRVFTPDGSIILDTQAPAGISRYDLLPGVYIITVGKETIKLQLY